MKAINIFSAAMLLICLMIVGSMDFNDELADQEYYCQMVAEGYWPKHRDFECKD